MDERLVPSCRLGISISIRVPNIAANLAHSPAWNPIKSIAFLAAN